MLRQGKHKNNVINILKNQINKLLRVFFSKNFTLRLFPLEYLFNYYLDLAKTIYEGNLLHWRHVALNSQLINYHWLQYHQKHVTECYHWQPIIFNFLSDWNQDCCIKQTLKKIFIIGSYNSLVRLKQKLLDVGTCQ